MADVLDVLTLAEAKAAVQIASADVSQDTPLAAYVTAVSRRLDQLAGPVVVRTIADELVDGGRTTVWVRSWPVTSFTTVTEHQATVPVLLTAETPTVQPDDGYLAVRYDKQPSLLSGQLIRRSAGRTRGFAPGLIKVTYVAGRYASTAVVDELFKGAARIMLQNLWRSEQQSVTLEGDYDVPAQSFPRFAIPTAVREMLADVWQATPGFS